MVKGSRMVKNLIQLNFTALYQLLCWLRGFPHFTPLIDVPSLAFLFVNLKTTPPPNGSDTQTLSTWGTFQTQTMYYLCYPVYSELLTPRGNPGKEGPRVADML